MTLVEAIKSGKRFRRKAWVAYTSPDYWPPNVAGPLSVTREDVLADDWEVKPDPVTITREQFNSAWDKAFSMDASTVERHIIMCRELGI
jgi:hypothetical protein